MLGWGWMLCWGGAGRVPDRSSSLALARSCMPAASLLVKDGEPGDSEKVAAWARHARPVGRGLFFFFFPPRDTCGILVPQSRMNGCPAAVEARSPSHWTARECWEGTLTI